MKKSNKKASKWLKKAGYLGIDDLETTDYNNDIPMDDLKTIDFNNDTEMSDLIDLKKTSGTKEIQSVKEVLSKNDITFIRQVPIHPRDRLKNLAAINEKVKFGKLHP